MPFSSKLRFCSYLCYSPRGASRLSEQSRDVCYGIKSDGFYHARRRPYVDYAVERLAADLPTYPFLADRFAPNVQLVPVPRSSPRKPGDFWPGLRLCEAIRAAGMAGGVLPIIERNTRIRRSALSAKNRPSPQEQIDTLGLATLLNPTDTITIVDDIVTRGSTFVATDRLLREAFPGVTIHAFGMVRTLFAEDATTIVDPIMGTIEFHEPNHLRRDP
jgi:hypothetical protein